MRIRKVLFVLSLSFFCADRLRWHPVRGYLAK